ncbi:MAG TPA: hypothetical protein VFV34_08780, partial [Blastocatellia bacterium]|nr:hypothetical protein [Blastocatellia bacterium]
DVFSFGVLLYEMLTGVRPFNGPGKIDLLHAVLHDQPPPPGTANVDVDAELEHIVLKALSKKPGDRYQTMHDMRADLIRFANKRGYAVKGVTTSAHTPVQRASSSVSLNRKPGLVALLLIVVAGLGWLLYRSGHSSLASTPGAGPRVPLAKWKMSPSDDIDLRPRFSPDGTMIVFASARNGQVNIWGKQIAGGGEPFQITYDRWADSNPIWSYDGQRIAFISDRGEGPGIFTCPALGHGTPKKLKSLEGNHRALIRWSKDSIYYELDFNLFKLDVATEQTTRVTDFVLSGLPEFAVSPQEDRFAFINRKGEVLDLWVMPMTGGNAIQLTNDPAEESNLAWDATGKRIFYTAKKNGIYQVFAAYVNGDTHSQVTFGDSDSVLSDVSLDGSLLVVSSSEESDLYCVRSDGRDETALTTDIGVEFWPDAARDETTIAFQAIRNSAEGSSVTRSLIVSRQAEAGAQETELASDGFEPKWSPDGSRLAFLRSSGLPGRADIWCVGQSGGNERRLTTAGLQPSRFTVLPLNRAYVSDYSWSPDGSRIAYCSDKSGLWNVWAVSADGSGETMFSRSADRDVTLGSPLWSHRGDQLACVSKSDSGNGRRLSSVWLSGFDPKLLIQTGAQLRLLGWSADDRGVFVALAEGRTSAPGAVTVIWVPVKEDLKDKNTRIVARLDAAYFSNIHLSNSGDRIAFVSGQGGKDNVWVVPATNGSPRRVTQNQEPRMYISSLAWTPRDNMIVYGKQAKYAVISMIDRLN